MVGSTFSLCYGETQFTAGSALADLSGAFTPGGFVRCSFLAPGTSPRRFRCLASHDTALRLDLRCLIGGATRKLRADRGGHRRDVSGLAGFTRLDRPYSTALSNIGIGFTFRLRPCDGLRGGEDALPFVSFAAARPFYDYGV